MIKIINLTFYLITRIYTVILNFFAFTYRFKNLNYFFSLCTHNLYKENKFYIFLYRRRELSDYTQKNV